MGGSRYDWEAIFDDYRAGVISVREVARRYDVDHGYLLRKAKKEGIERDLTSKVNQAVKRKLVTKRVTKVTTPDNGDESGDKLTDDEIVDAKSDEVFDVVQSHCTLSKTAGECVSLLFSQLLDAAEQRDDLEQLIEEEAEGMGLVASKRKALLRKALSLQSHSIIASNLSNAFTRFVNVERLSHGLDDGSKKEDLETVVIHDLSLPPEEGE